MNEPRIRCRLAGLALLSAVLTGCGGGTPHVASAAAPPKAAKQLLPAAAIPAATVAAAPINTPGKAAAERKPVRKLTLNPFQMPDIPEEFLPSNEPNPAEYAAPIRQTERPKIRLLGFSDVDGCRALVELKGDVLAVEEGDVVEGVQIVSIKPPSVTFQFANSNWSTKLFGQPWSNQQTSLVSSPAASRASASQSHSTTRGSLPAYGPRTPLAATNRAMSEPDSMEDETPEVGGSGTLPAIQGPPNIPGLPFREGNSGPPSSGSIPGMPSGGVPGVPGAPGGIPGGINSLSPGSAP